MCEDLAVRVFKARVAGGLLGSGLKASSLDMLGLCSSEHGTTDMEMERPWVPGGCRGVKWLPEPMGEKASELQEPESGLRSPSAVRE